MNAKWLIADEPLTCPVCQMDCSGHFRNEYGEVVGCDRCITFFTEDEIYREGKEDEESFWEDDRRWTSYLT